MNKEFVGARLQFSSVDELTEQKSRVTLNDLDENAPASDVLVVRDALQTVLDDPIESTQAIITYQYA